MWFAKWFGGGEDDSEASEHPPHPIAMNAPRTVSTADRPPQTNTGVKAKAAPRKGFDPYNSGSFDKNKAWSRVIR